MAAAGRGRDLAMTDDDYRAYSYLPAGTLPPFDLTPEFGRVPPYQGASLTDEQARRPAALLRASLGTRPARRPLRLGHPADRDRLLRRQPPGQRAERANRRGPDRVRPPGGDPDEPTGSRHRPVALLGPDGA